MELPNSVKLTKIQTQNTFCDKKSFEKFTQQIKPKFKVCADSLPKELQVHLFFVSTTTKDSYRRDFVVIVDELEWENRIGNYLKDVSYLSVTHLDCLSDDDIISKINDPENGFELVARLPDNKYQELKTKYLKKRNKLTLQRQELGELAFSVELALSEEDKEDTIKRLGI